MVLQRSRFKRTLAMLDHSRHPALKLCLHRYHIVASLGTGRLVSSYSTARITAALREATWYHVFLDRKSARVMTVPSGRGAFISFRYVAHSQISVYKGTLYLDNALTFIPSRVLGPAVLRRWLPLQTDEMEPAQITGEVFCGYLQ